MESEEIGRIAESECVQPGLHSKTDQIRAIQTGEGNFDCFATAYTGECDQSGCRWRDDCFDASKQGEIL